jgi:hypothetical protein
MPKLVCFQRDLNSPRLNHFIKKGDKRDMENYRPISLLCTFSNIMEKLMYNRLLFFLTSNTVLTDAKHGFRKSRSTETAIQSLLASVRNQLKIKKTRLEFFVT